MLFALMLILILTVMVKLVAASLCQISEQESIYLLFSLIFNGLVIMRTVFWSCIDDR